MHYKAVDKSDKPQSQSVVPKSGSQAERLTVFNAVRGVERAQQYYSFPKKDSEDVHFDLVELDKVPFGQDFSLTVHIQVWGPPQYEIKYLMNIRVCM